MASSNTTTLHSGRLRHRVDIEQPVETQDTTSGDMIRTWAVFASQIAAEIVPLSATQFLQSSALQSQIDTRIMIRNRPGLQPNMRIKHIVFGEVRIYDIQGILRDPDSGLDFVTIPCSTGVNDG